jgi:phenylacetate-CoA ligase
MSVFYSQEAVDWTSATNMFVLELAGRKRHMKELHLASLFPEVFPLKDRIKEHVKCFAMNRSNIFTHSFEDKDLETIWKKLKRIKPYLIQGHPSTLYALSLYLNKKNYDAKRVIHVFESTGEVLDQKKKKLIEKTFGCSTINRYGNAEFGVIAYETKHSEGTLQVIDFMVYPECIKNDENGISEIVVTGLTNDAMPLIRYCTGDMAKMVKKNDGIHYKEIDGRVHDIIRIGEKKYPTHYLQDLIDRIGGILEFQVRQISTNKIQLILVPDNGIDRQYIENRIKSWWKNDVNVIFCDLSELKRTGWRGKFRYLIHENIFFNEKEIDNVLNTK